MIYYLTSGVFCYAKRSTKQTIYTLRFIREKKAISFDYVTRITKFKEEKIVLWEDNESDKFPTINQAKAIAKCYRVPFAGLYMNASDINVKHLPQMRNLRTLPGYCQELCANSFANSG